MAVLSVKVRIAEKGMVKTMQFDPSTIVFDACKIIREKMPEANLGQPKDYGLFLADDDPKKGVWMDSGRPLEYYLVRSGDLLEYKKKIRTLRIRMLDGTVKTLLVDDSQPLGQLMVVICTRIGITNHDEYSLVRETGIEDKERISMQRKEDKVGTLTLGRSKEKKMEQLRKQLHTDEELNWLDHGKTLREQGLEESETLLLRRKYFFSDQNIDARDPVQLNLLFVQCRNGVLEGVHPVSVEEAFQLAGLQCQVQFGDFVETKHRSGFLELKEFLPKEYLKIKGAEKRVLQEYRNRRGWSENDARVEYIRRCRSLKTYGVTFFLVKEKMKGKNKLVPRLLGVNKDSVIRVDERTKEVLKVWPLEQVRRWAASPNTFTLDFGDYQDQYYSVQTTDGEKIAQLIAGYIDILLKRRKAKDHFGVEGDEGSTMLEDTVAPAKATLMSRGELAALQGEEGNIALPGVMRAGINGEMSYGTGSVPKPQYGAVGGVVIGQHPPVAGQQPKVIDTMSRAQRALVGTIKTSIKTIEKAEEDLQSKAPLPPLGDDLASRRWKDNERDVSKQKVQDQLAAIGAATAEVVQKTGAIPDRVDHTAVGAAISTISSNIPDMTKGVRTVAALMDEEDRGDRLLDAARRLCKAFSDLLRSVNPETQDTRQNFLAAAGRVGDYSKNMIETMEEPTDAEKEFQDMLIQLAKAVATTTAKLVLEAKAVSGHCENQALQEHVVHSATECAFATSQLVACTRVVAPTIDSPACQDQLTDAARQVAKAVEQLLKDAEFACKDERSLGNLRDAAGRVSRNLNDLLGHIKTGPRRPEYSDVHVDTIMASTQRIISVHDDQKDVITNARMVAEATGSLITHMKSEADTDSDRDHRQRLMGAAKKLADATTRMIEAAKSCASSPLDFENQRLLRTAAEEVRDATSYAAHDNLRRAPFLKLEQAVKQTIANATQSVAAASVCEPTNKNQLSQQDLTVRCEEVASLTPRVIASMKQFRLRPDDGSAHLELLRTSNEFVQPCDNLVRAGKAAVPTVTNEAAALQLSNATKNLSQSLVELRMCISRVRIFEDLDDYTVKQKSGLCSG